MAVVSSIGRKFISYFSPRKSTRYRNVDAGLETLIGIDEAGSRSDSLSNSDLENRVDPEDENIISLELEGDTLLSAKETGKRRRATPESEGERKKRRKTLEDAWIFEHGNSSDFEDSTLLASTPIPRTKGFDGLVKMDADRTLMPPPTSPRSRRPGEARKSVGDDGSDLGSVAASAIGRTEAEKLDDYDIEKARRYAEAIKLPPGSGVWSQAEKDLFYHLSLRGFEPLLPTNWMIDFRTLPISLYARSETDSPLVQPQDQRQFRAIRALRDLIDLGMRVRGRAISQQRKRLEPEIRKRISRYVSWALKDVGMHSSQRCEVIPVHVITTMKRGRTTQEAIQDLTTSLHALARRWRQVYNIRDSIEVVGQDLTRTRTNNDEPKVARGDEEEDGPPILYGILICSSVIMIVTMNAHHDLLPPELPSVKLEKDRESDGSSGLRMIATFDFSDNRQDVWNALAVAIVVMCIRDEILQQYRRAAEQDQAGRGSMWDQEAFPSPLSPSSSTATGVQPGWGRGRAAQNRGEESETGDSCEDPDA